MKPLAAPQAAPMSHAAIPDAKPARSADAPTLMMLQIKKAMEGISATNSGVSRVFSRRMPSNTKATRRT
jgi:hypothetical protein